MKTVLIVGSTSAVGRSVGRLLEKSHKVFFAGRRDADYYLDMGSVDVELPANLHFDVVIHAIADFGGHEEEDYCRAELVNAIGTLNICRLARKLGAGQIVIISSSFANYLPGDPYYNIYSLSKRHADELAQLYCGNHGLPLTILRPTQLYDAESRLKRHQGLFYLIIDKAQNGDEIVFYGSNDALRNYIYLDDFSEVIVRCIQKGITGVFNCPSPRSVKLTEVADTAYKVFNHRGSVRFLADKPDIVDLSAVPGSDLYQKIGYEPSTSLSDGIHQIRNMRELI
ncbi:MAG: NAD(P)-dependent oxidoreductase [Gammaproteobacteria bacterium]|nr:NAD(P)-dependent oxidoreductase [Gammaproteobacteria bacterium]